MQIRVFWDLHREHSIPLCFFSWVDGVGLSAFPRVTVNSQRCESVCLEWERQHGFHLHKLMCMYSMWTFTKPGSPIDCQIRCSPSQLQEQYLLVFMDVEKWEF